MFHRITGDGKMIPFGGNQLKALTFEHNDEIELFVSTLDYVHAAPLKFAYKLEDEWVTANDNCINLGQLPFGHYTLQVKVLDGKRRTCHNVEVQCQATPLAFVVGNLLICFLLWPCGVVDIKAFYFLSKTT